MKTLEVPFINRVISSIAEAEEALKAEPALILDRAPWKEYPYVPRVSFKIARASDSLILQYYVEEKSVRADFSSLNDPVCRDSCVEFFINPGDGSYFNLEVSCIGTAYMAHGTSRETSRPLPVGQVAAILSKSSLGNKPFAERDCPEPWEITISLPLTLFSGTDLAEPAGRSFRANFYKCGDNLKEPHFLAWNEILTETPDFHRPEYFGTLHFL